MIEHYDQGNLQKEKFIWLTVVGQLEFITGGGMAAEVAGAES